MGKASRKKWEQKLNESLEHLGEMQNSPRLTPQDVLRVALLDLVCDSIKLGDLDAMCDRIDRFESEMGESIFDAVFDLKWKVSSFASSFVVRCASSTFERAMPRSFASPHLDSHQMAQILRIAKTQVGFVQRKARLLLALAEPKGLSIGQICSAHGFANCTAHRLIANFSAQGVDALAYRLNHESAAKRRKLSPQSEARAAELARDGAQSLKQIMARLIAEGLHPADEPLTPRTLADCLRRAGMSWQRTRYSLKKT
jgi:transposase